MQTIGGKGQLVLWAAVVWPAE